MLDFNAILDIVTTIFLAIVGYGLYLLRTGTEAAVKASAEEAAKATLRALQWPMELTRELQKTIGIERQELRFKSYAALWKELRPLAIYDATVIDKAVTAELSAKLSDWYFSERGGILLTPQARNFYFTLQDLLRTTSKFSEDWSANRSDESEGDQKRIFREVLTASGADEATHVFDHFTAGVFDDWHHQAVQLGEHWRKGIKMVIDCWKDLDSMQRFAALQQVGSILRTSLVNDLESRLQ